MRLLAQVTNQGTAMPETTLCSNCYKISAFRAAHWVTVDSENNTPLKDTTWHDVTGNSIIHEVGCQSCGWPSRIEMSEFMRVVGEAFPFASVDEDNEGQVIIFTGLTTERELQPDGSDTVVGVILMDDEARQL